MNQIFSIKKKLLSYEMRFSNSRNILTQLVYNTSNIYLNNSLRQVVFQIKIFSNIFSN